MRGTHPARGMGLLLQVSFTTKREDVMVFRKKMLSCSVAGALLAMAGNAAASGFGLLEQSASAMGNAYAGGAAAGEDASTIFFNPAGMSRLSGKQVAVALHAIRPSAKFSGSVTG